MSLFNDLEGKLTGDATVGEGGQGGVARVLEMLTSQQGGMPGLVQAFEQNGLSHIVASWIGPGGNLPISPEQIQQVLGGEQVEALAQKMGVSPEAARSHLAAVLPGIVDKLTPGGEVPKEGDPLSGGIGLLQGLMSKFK